MDTMKKIYTYTTVFILGILLGWYVTSINVKPEAVEKKQTNTIHKLEKKVAVQNQKVKSNKFLWVFNKDNMLWCGVGYVLALL